MPNRNETLRVGFKAAEVDMTFDDFKRMLRDWKIRPVIVEDSLAGMIASKNTEIHACILPEFRGRWFSRHVYKQTILPILKQYGFVTTAVPDDKPHGHGFVQKFGFTRTHRDGKFTFYRMERSKWA